MISCTSKGRCMVCMKLWQQRALYCWMLVELTKRCLM